MRLVVLRCGSGAQQVQARKAQQGQSRKCGRQVRSSSHPRSRRKLWCLLAWARHARVLPCAPVFFLSLRHRVQVDCEAWEGRQPPSTQAQDRRQPVGARRPKVRAAAQLRDLRASGSLRCVECSRGCAPAHLREATACQPRIGRHGPPPRAARGRAACASMHPPARCPRRTRRRR